MGEKGNLADVGEEIFANLASQSPQFWLDYEQYRHTKGKTAEERVVAQAAAQGPAAEQPANRATG